jgi:menaquinol-cytochrome c reductase iron-sulfur subunit
MQRRKFLSAAIYAIGGLISAGLGLPAISFIVAPAVQDTQAGEWLRLGAISKIEIGVPTLFKAKIKRQTGWITSETEVSVYALTDNGRDFVAMSNICTHLGCRARWIAQQDQFYCPCHAGVYAKDGSVISGPPPRPLDRYPAKVENGQLLILIS